MMENSSSLGMSDPIFGTLHLRKYRVNTFEPAIPPIQGRNVDLTNPNAMLNDLSPQRPASVANPLATNVFLPHDSVRNIPTNLDYKRDLIIAQRELMNAHDEIVKLEAELRAARYK